jgi:hypothetical protein
VGLRRRVPEIVLVVLGVVVRLTILRSLPPEKGYDFRYHWEYVEWFARHWTMPPVDALREAFHPPLFFALAGELVRWGAGPRGVQLIAVVGGCLKLALVWLGLELYLPASRTARLVALATAAILPASVHVDALVSPEPLNALLVAVALLVAPLVLAGRTRHPTTLAAIVGLALGLALLTKISTITTIAVLGVVVVGQFLAEGHGGVVGRVRRLAPWLVGGLVLIATSGWYVVRNETLYDRAFLTSFDGQESDLMAATRLIPVVFRRPPEFVTGWSGDIFAMPFYPSASLAHARFFPMLVASTFTDYYNHAFAPHRPASASFAVYDKPMPRSVLPASRASMAGGTWLAVLTVVGWVASAAVAWRRRAWDASLLLLVPMSALLGQLAFAIVYPHDWLGVVKGVYLQFAVPPLFGVLGLAVAWLAQRRLTAPLAWVSIAALAMVAWYTVYCRTL